MRKKSFLYITLVLLLWLFLCVSLSAKTVTEENIVLNAMEDELTRSTKELKLDMFGPPYFISYQIKDNFMIDIGGDFGAIYRDNNTRYKNLYVEVRVGSYESDNSDVGVPNRFRHIRIPIEDDEDSLKRNLWLATDRSYKNAVSAYLRKQGKDIQKMDIDKLADFSKGEKNISIEKVENSFDFDTEKWRKIIKNVSSHFKKFDDIVNSDVTLSARKTIRYYVNSEGTKIVDQNTLINITISAWAQAEDGMWLSDKEILHYTKMEDMPSEDKINEKLFKLVDTLSILRKSELIDPYIGPAIFEPDAAGVLFHEAVGHRLEGERQRNEKEGSTFKNKIGKSIMPDFITLYDDPTLKEFNGIPLFGYYKFDNEGQRGEKVLLAEDGVLRNFLLSRAPIKGFSKSNGHGRADDYRDPIARMANLIMKASKEISREDLKKELIKEAKRQKKNYGLIIKKVTGGETNTSRYNFQAFKGSPTLIYKVYVDDAREELVRGAEFVGTPMSSINRIIAAGDDYSVFNGFCGAESGYVPVSAVSPSILLSEIELQRKAFKNAKLPILSPPAIKK